MVHKSILVVDDESEMRLALKEVLNRCGYWVTTAENGADALDKFRQNIFNLVITDIKMGKISGMEVFREVKKMAPEIPVVLITAYGSITDAVSAMKEGASDYIVKPFSYDDLEEVVKKTLSIRETEKYHPQQQLHVKNNEKKIISTDPQMLRVLEMAKSVARSKATVLIYGESGTGKELLAHLIHQYSPRKREPFIAVNCAALPDGLLESELFGYEKGAFTGAVAQKKGKFELANHGTILLDEISELPFILQAKLLRILQEEEIDRVGGSKPFAIDVRVIATTNKDLSKEVHENRFREDLFYRLNVIPITLPSLRERKKDIPTSAAFATLR